MKFFIADDSASVRAMLTDIIEAEELGVVVGVVEDGSEVYVDQLQALAVDILLIDLLMPNRNGIDTVLDIKPSFTGKIVMISQVESKEMIGKAYSIGIDQYITKPINKLEVTMVLKKVIEQTLLTHSINEIKKSLGILQDTHQEEIPQANHIIHAGRSVLMELGIIGENGNKDLLDILRLLQEQEREGIHMTPPLKEIYEQVVRNRFHNGTKPEKLHKEIKACEQRIRRSIHQAFKHVASLGLTDYTSTKFEYLATSFFDFNQVRMKMKAIENGSSNSIHQPQVNIRKFILAFYMTAKQKLL